MIINKSNSQQLKLFGYTVFPLLQPNHIQQLKVIYNHYESVHNLSDEKFKGSAWIKDKKIILEINKEIEKILFPILSKWFYEFQVLGYNFLLKEKNDAESFVPPHQDWSYVDELKYYSINVWIALEDVNEENGCLYFLPRSHRVGNYIRASPSYPVPFQSFLAQLKTLSVNIKLKAGDCVCFNNKTIHGSLANTTNTSRLAVVTTLFPKPANLLHYYIHNSGNIKHVTKYEIDNETFLTLERGQPPTRFLSKKTLTAVYPQWTFSFFKRQLFKLRLKDFFISNAR